MACQQELAGLKKKRKAMGKAKRLRKEKTARRRQKADDEYWQARFMAEVKHEMQLKVGKKIMAMVSKRLFDKLFEVFKKTNPEMMNKCVNNFRMVETSPEVMTAKVMNQIKWLVDKEKNDGRQ